MSGARVVSQTTPLPLKIGRVWLQCVLGVVLVEFNFVTRSLFNAGACVNITHINNSTDSHHMLTFHNTTI